MKLINIGFGSMVAASRVLAIVAPDSAPIKRVVQEARDYRFGMRVVFVQNQYDFLYLLAFDL